MYKCLFLNVLVLLAIDTAQTQFCPDRWALQNISAFWKGPNDKVGGFYNDSANFYLLENSSMIHIVKANVTVLCDGMVKDFRQLKYLALTDSNISKILPEAFQQLPKLTSLSLAVNNLNTIKNYHFKNLKKLKLLYLSSNLIDFIEPDTFTELVDLEKIYLDKNRIAEIDNNWFLNNHKMSLINLAFNRISKLQTQAFTLSKNSVTEIRLQYNIIEEIEDKVVISEGVDEEEPYLNLYLNNNNIMTIPKDFVRSMDKLHSTLYFNSNNITCVPKEFLDTLKATSVNLYIINNPLDCTCLYNISNFVKKNEMRVPFHYNSTKDCKVYGFQNSPERNQLRHH